MAKMAAQPDFQEIGSTGLQRTSGFVIDDFITNLRGVQGMRVWREMSDNDPVVGAMLYAIERLILAIEWNVEPYTEKKTDSIKRKDQVQADFIKECMDDMSESWPAMLSQILSFLPFGFAYCEIVYKKRQGPDQKTVAASPNTPMARLAGGRFLFARRRLCGIGSLMRTAQLWPCDSQILLFLRA